MMGIPSQIFDPLKCTSTAFLSDGNGNVVFAPFGQAGKKYHIESDTQRDQLFGTVAKFCNLAVVLLLALFGVFTLTKIGVLTKMMPWGGWIGGLIVVWAIAFGLWSLSATKNLKVAD
jgi:hypothetical protein